MTLSLSTGSGLADTLFGLSAVLLFALALVGWDWFVFVTRGRGRR